MGSETSKEAGSTKIRQNNSEDGLTDTHTTDSDPKQYRKRNKDRKEKDKDRESKYRDRESKSQPASSSSKAQPTSPPSKAQPTSPPSKAQPTSPSRNSANNNNGNGNMGSPRKSTVTAAPLPPSPPKNSMPKAHSRDMNGPTSPNTSHSMISSFVADEEVKVNLAMADLMAYLQVVANNSSNLPLTRRDDPELHKTVSNLTSEEYARKSAAFLPSDVRVIAGSFTKYGRVWDLPTSDEFNAVDGAHEPGRSYGGACANAMLKVLYDAANTNQDHDDDVAGGGNGTTALDLDGHNVFPEKDSLFDDDEESTMASHISIQRDRTFQSLVLGDVATSATLTWAELLRKMKAEIAEIEYAQAPTLTTTRKFDINTPFTLVPESFDETKNTKRSLLIGCNYSNIHGAELKASHDDISSMKDYIVNVHGFPEQKGVMTILLDDDKHKHPTHLNICEAFKALSEQAMPGDAVFVQFSGHGGRVLDEDQSYDEVMVPSDFQTSGLIRDTLIFKTLLAPMRYGVTVTILLDCCDTGMMLDLPYSWSTKTDRIETLAKLSLNDDFSFVRFLKVVKTLYEASTFTQLGRTVGSALRAPVMDECDDDDDLDDDGTMGADDESLLDGGQRRKKKNGSLAPIFAALTSCNDPQDATLSTKNGDRADHSTIGTKHPSSFMDKVLNSCTGLGADEGLSDDDTYGGRSMDPDPTTTFETEDDRSYHERRGRRRR